MPSSKGEIQIYCIYFVRMGIPNRTTCAFGFPLLIKAMSKNFQGLDLKMILDLFNIIVYCNVLTALCNYFSSENLDCSPLVVKYCYVISWWSERSFVNSDDFRTVWFPVPILIISEFSIRDIGSSKIVTLTNNVETTLTPCMVHTHADVVIYLLFASSVYKP